MQNNCSARASRFLVHFFDVRCTTTTWSLPMRRFMEDFLYLNMDKVLNISTPGKVAYICRIERFQIDALKIERTQTHFLVMFSLPSSSSSMLKVPICTMTSYYDQQNFSVCCFFVQSRAVFLNLSQGWKDLISDLKHWRLERKQRRPELFDSHMHYSACFGTCLRRPRKMSFSLENVIRKQNEMNSGSCSV